MRLRYGPLRTRRNSAEDADGVSNAHLEAIQLRADEPELTALSDDDFPYDDDDFVYDAFISYTRGNLDVANKIERGLESFLLPREIRKRVGRRCLNVFLDVSDLTGNRLDPALEHNLERSRTWSYCVLPRRAAPAMSPRRSTDSPNSATPKRSFRC